jgi:hypothetical protein
MPRIEAAVMIYTCLSRIRSLKGDTNKKLTSMLLHPYPKVWDPTQDIGIRGG